MDQFVGDNMETVIPPELGDGEAKVVLVTHDESSFEAHDGKRFVWIESEKNLLRPKGAGRSIMVSQFLCMCHGAMEITLTDDILERFPHLPGVPGQKVETLRVIKPGKNADGYWTNKDLIEQVKVTQTLFDILHPGCAALFAFDNSQNHRAMAPDALVANRLNLSDGGSKVPHMRKGWFERNGEIVEQEMQFEDSGRHHVNGRVQKGIRRILIERGLWPPGGLSLDAARELLRVQPDFASQKMWLQETIESSGSAIILYPKFHPEFNWIEMYWGQTKRYCRKHCTYSFKDLIRILPEALRSVPLSTMKRFARKSFRYMDAYREKNGQFLSIKQVEHAVRKYRGHRTIPASIMAEL